MANPNLQIGLKLLSLIAFFSLLHNTEQFWKGCILLTTGFILCYYSGYVARVLC